MNLLNSILLNSVLLKSKSTHFFSKAAFGFVQGLALSFLLASAVTLSYAAETPNLQLPLQSAQPDALDNYLGEYLNESELQHSAESDVPENLWDRIRAGFAMPEAESTYTQQHLDWYSSRPDYMTRMADRSQKYLFHIVEEVEKRGMPTEIALLPMVESAFNPQAYSRSKAAGIWQFIPSTGKDFGLQQNWWVDNRRDVMAATNAALNYLEKLHGLFGSWDLALAAYNAGEGTVQRAILRNQQMGLPTDYQNLNLPLETRNYVPKLYAIKKIIAEPEQFGLTLKEIPNRPYFVRVTAPKQIDAKLAAELAEISYDEFSALNPSYNRPFITSSGEGHAFLLPVWSAPTYQQNLVNYDKPLSRWKTYLARKGEKLTQIAKKMGLQVSALAQANGLSARHKLRNNQTLLVPSNGAQEDSVTAQNESHFDDLTVAKAEKTAQQTDETEPKHASKLTHKVARGDTLFSIARAYQLQPKFLMKINGISAQKLRLGQYLKLGHTKTAEKQKTRLKFSHANATSKKNIRSQKQRTFSIKARSGNHAQSRSHKRRLR